METVMGAIKTEWDARLEPFPALKCFLRVQWRILGTLTCLPLFAKATLRSGTQILQSTILRERKDAVHAGQSDVSLLIPLPNLLPKS